MRKQVDIVNQTADELAHGVFESVHTVMHLYRSRQYRVLREGLHDLTHMENKVLGFFARHPGATQSDLVAYWRKDKAQLTRLIRGLKNRGLVEARVDQSDRRNNRLHLTPQGEAVHQILDEQATRLARIAVNGLNEKECAMLVALLGKVRANLEADPE